MATPSAQIHRFRDTVAAYLGDGATTYLTPQDARKLARALNACARDCEQTSFVGSAFKTFTLFLTRHD